jgi:glycosyltransferase involved in cell wall biosynthesis
MNWERTGLRIVMSFMPVSVNNMDQIAPFFSIIIPTRNRYETLKYTIRTVLSQKFGSFELIISDNSDPANFDQAGLISEYLGNERVKYFRPETVLSMSDSWEFALSHAKGEYIIIFGDDDGLIRGSLNRISEIIRKTGANLVSWARVEYSWPDRLPIEYANVMDIPYVEKTGMVNGKEYIKKLISFEADYRHLPMFYNSAVSKNLVNLLKEKTGRVFNAASPDIYSGYAFAHLAKKYICIGRPLSINGVSAKSNGAAHINEDESIKADYWKTFNTSEIKWPQSIPVLPVNYLGVLEPFLQLSRFFPELKGYISRKKIYRILVDTVEAGDHKGMDEKRRIILESAKNDHSLHSWLRGYAHKAAIRNKPVSPGHRGSIMGFSGEHLFLDGSKFGLKTVDDVSVFVDDLLGDIKDTNFLKPAALPLLNRIKKAAAILLRGL